MTELSFDVVRRYDSDDGIRIPLNIICGGRETETTAYVDCGASDCIFSNETGLLLGLQIETGELKYFSPASGGTLAAYGHLVTLEFFGIAFESIVYFAKYPGLQRNLLGRNGWLRKLFFGLVESDSTVYLSPLS